MVDTSGCTFVINTIWTFTRGVATARADPSLDVPTRNFCFFEFPPGFRLVEVDALEFSRALLCFGCKTRDRSVALSKSSEAFGLLERDTVILSKSMAAMRERVGAR